MSAIEYIKGLLGLTTDDVDGLAALQDALASREAELSLTAEYGRPTISNVGEPTAVFPVSLYHEGEEYGAASKEFALPDNGLADDSNLAAFLAERGIEDVSDLADIEGQTDDATIGANGDLVVGV